MNILPLKRQQSTLSQLLFNILIGGPSQCNMARKRNRRYRDFKKEVKLSLFTGNMIVYREKPARYSRKLLELIS